MRRNLYDDIATLIKPHFGCRVQIGKLYKKVDSTGSSSNAENYLVIVLYPQGATSNNAIGGKSSYGRETMKVLVHGDNKSKYTRELADAVYKFFEFKKFPELSIYCQPIHSRPLLMGRDEYGVWEYIIDIDIIYTNNE